VSHQRAKKAAAEIVDTLRGAGYVAYLAGGCVRDLLLGVEPQDFDVATDARPERVMELFRRTEKVGAKFGVVLVRLRGVQTEVATFRTDGHYADGRHPDSVTFGDEVEDARRRDFTINGMFYDPAAQRVIDHVGGQEDLRRQVIRAIGEPERRFQEDHLRMLRAVRFAARLGFAVDGETLASIRRHAHRLSSISAERVREELRLILCDRTRAEGWRLLIDTGLADELVHGLNWSAEEAAAVGRRLADMKDDASFILILAAVWCSRPPDAAAAFCRDLRCSNTELRGVEWLLKQLPRIREPDALELADVKLLSVDERFDDLLELLGADLAASSQSPEAHRLLRQRYQAIPAEERLPAPFITGADLLSRGVPQGPNYAVILHALYRAQLNNELANREEAIKRLEELIRAIPRSADKPLGQ